MASIRAPYGGSEIAGSVGNTTFQRGSSGLIMRARATPVNPNTTKQIVIRAAMANASAAWTNTLTAAERTAWEDYATTTPLPNRFGDNINVGGRQMFLRTSVALVNNGGSVANTAPTTPGVAAPILLTLTGDTTAGIEIASVSPAIPTGAVLFVGAGIPVSQARNYYKAPFSKTAVLTSASTYPFALRDAGDCAIGQRYYYSARIIQEDAKVSEQTVATVDILT